MEGIGISSPNCLDRDGDTVWAFTTQGQAISMNLSGQSEPGNYVTEILQTFPPTSSYIAAHRMGSDSALFVGDGTARALRQSFALQAWSTTYQPVGGIKAISSIETSPGVYTLCAGRATGGGYILGRDLTTWQDDGENYTNCTVTIGSITLSQPGSVLVPVEYIVGYFDAVGTIDGGPSVPKIEILPNEITGVPGPGFLLLSNPTQEPPIGQNIASATLQSLRWPTDSINSGLASKLMHHLQIRITFAPENAPNAIKALAIMNEKD
jgi:hypothetical protein